MKTKTIRHKPASIAKARWATYAAAAAATTLAGAPRAEAEIHYSGLVKHPFPGDSSASFPLNSDANLFFDRFTFGASDGAARLEIVGPSGPNGNSLGSLAGQFIQYGGFYISNLASRQQVSRLRFGAYCRYTSTGSGSELHCFGGTIGYSQRPHGQFRYGGQGFIGFTFNTGSGPQYGWARIQTDGAPGYRFILLDYAWADPGESIQTGQKHSAEDAKTVTKSGSLGLLALGGAGLIAWRRRCVSSPDEG